MRALPLSVSPALAAGALLCLLAPFVWTGGVAPQRWWLLPALSALLWFSARGGRGADVVVLGAAAVAVLASMLGGLGWYEALGLTLHYGVVAAAAGVAVQASLHGRERQLPHLPTALLAAVWLTAPTAPGLLALLGCAALTSELRQPAATRGPRTWRAMLGVAGLCALLAALSLPLAGLNAGPLRYVDAGGQHSEFYGFRLGRWNFFEAREVPGWLNALPAGALVLVALLALLGLVALVWALRTALVVAREDRHSRPGRQTDEPARTEAAPASPEDGVRQAYAQFLLLARQAGLARRANETPAAFERRVSAERPAWAPHVRTLGAAYAPVRYGREVPGPLQEAARAAVDAMRETHAA